MLRHAAVAVLVVGTAVSLTTVARRRLDHGANGNGRTHAHLCFLCAGEWSHGGRCADGRARLCPWCLAGSRAEGDALPPRVVNALQEIGPACRGRHAHNCPTCLTTWTHRQGGACTAGDRAALPECPGCLRLRAMPYAMDQARTAP